MYLTHAYGRHMAAVTGIVVLIASIAFADAGHTYATDSGMVCFEAENYTSKEDKYGIGWEEVTTFPGYTGTGAMQALPDSGIAYLTNYIESSAVLNYDIQFNTADTFFVYVRLEEPHGGSNSIHIGLDGDTVNAQGERLDIDGSWDWRDAQRHGGRAYVIIENTGMHTFNIWFREDGVAVDSVVLTTEDEYEPDIIAVRRPLPSSYVPHTTRAHSAHAMFDCMGRLREDVTRRISAGDLPFHIYINEEREKAVLYRR